MSHPASPNPVGVALLDALASIWPSPLRAQIKRIGADPWTEEYALGYTTEQFMTKVWHGIRVGTAMPPLWGKTVLEIGCGHGGITCYLAAIGAKRVVGIDLNVDHVLYGRRLAAEIARQSGRPPLPVSFMQMDASNLALDHASFDAVYADNVFEHFSDPETVLRELARVLRPGGVVLIPTFSSINSKYGLHLKVGLKLPWTNLLFSERTIIEALKRQAQRRPELYDAYPGLGNAPERVRDVRQFRDLNDITHQSFRALAERQGFVVRSFQVHATLTGRLARKLVPRIERTALLDVLSTGASAVLEKRP